MLNQSINKNNLEWAVKEVAYCGATYRCYNEAHELVCAQFCLYNETSYKIVNLMDEFNFKAYYIKSEPLTNLKVFVEKKKIIKIDESDVYEIKRLQRNDFLYLYYNILFEVLYTFPNVDKNNNYSYDLLVLVPYDFDINKIIKHNFNLIKIKNCTEKKKENINFKFIESLYENRTIFGKDDFLDKDYEYDSSHTKLLYKDYVKEYLGGDEEKYDSNVYNCISSFKFYKLFNQNLYVFSHFAKLCCHIWDFGEVIYYEKNKHGLCMTHDDLYNSVVPFFSNYNEIMGIKTVKKEVEEIKVGSLEYYSCSLSENYMTLDIMDGRLTKEWPIQGYIDLKNKETRVTDEMLSSNKHAVYKTKF